MIDKALIRLAVLEDLPAGDATIRYTRAETVAADIRARTDCVVCGIPYLQAAADAVCDHLSLAPVRVNAQVADGDRVVAGTTVATVQGLSHAVFASERIMLNFLMRLSGLATHAHAIRHEVPAQIVVLDTRKTTPGWRMAEKYAFRVGGLVNHRHNLSQAAMMKDSHRPYWDLAQLHAPRGPLDALEIEVDNLGQLQDALACNPNVVMLDNFSHDDVAQALQQIPVGVQVEISGNVDMHDLPPAIQGQHLYISLGKALQDFSWIDFGLDHLADHS